MCGSGYQTCQTLTIVLNLSTERELIVKQLHREVKSTLRNLDGLQLSVVFTAKRNRLW